VSVTTPSMSKMTASMRSARMTIVRWWPIDLPVRFPWRLKHANTTRQRQGGVARLYARLHGDRARYVSLVVVWAITGDGTVFWRIFPILGWASDSHPTRGTSTAAPRGRSRSTARWNGPLTRHAAVERGIRAPERSDASSLSDLGGRPHDVAATG